MDKCSRNNFIDVYYAQIPLNPFATPIFCEARTQENSDSKAEKVKREKHAVWALLEYALTQSLQLSPKDVVFEKNGNGKWTCDKFHFSLSHSKDAVAVAISDSPVGVDIQAVTRPTPATTRKIFDEKQLDEYATLSSTEQAAYFTRVWAKKESAFKVQGGNGFFLNEPNDDIETLDNVLVIDDKRYAVAVSAKRLYNVTFYPFSF